MDLPRISYAQTDARDGAVINMIREGVGERLTRPKELPRLLPGLLRPGAQLSRSACSGPRAAGCHWAGRGDYE
jgi:hypothetical protein